MSRFRGPIFTVLALIAACGGKVIVDSNSGGGDQGAGSSGSTSGTVGVGGSDFVTTGTATTTGTGIGVAGSATNGGSFGVGGAYVAGAGGYYACGPVVCPPGGQCCNPQCGICVPQGAPCPASSCGSAGSAGSFGAGGGCGSPATCQARLPGPLSCPNETACVCGACACQTNVCANDPLCQQILQCSLKLNCHGKGCYDPQTCMKVIDQFGGPGSPPMQLFLALAQCRSNSGCDGACSVGGSGGGPLGCPIPPPMIGGQCSGSYFPQDGRCTEQCYDGNMNSYVANCSGGICQCVFDGKPLCSCFNGGFGGFGGAPCGSCCPGMR